MELPTSHAFKRMKKEKVIEYAIKMRNNLEGELSVALAERDQADEANQKFQDEKVSDQVRIDILKDEISRLEHLGRSRYDEILKLKEENKMLKETINQMKQLLSHV